MRTSRSLIRIKNGSSRKKGSFRNPRIRLSSAKKWSARSKQRFMAEKWFIKRSNFALAANAARMFFLLPGVLIRDRLERNLSARPTKGVGLAHAFLDDNL